MLVEISSKNAETRNYCVPKCRIKVAWLAIFLALGGCATNSVLPDPAREDSVIAFTKDLEQTTSTLLDKVVVAIPNPAAEHPDYLEWAANWCPRHETVHSISGVQSEIGLYCQRKGGAYQNGFCREANEPDLVLFYAMVSRRGDCQNVAFPVGVQIIEPKGTNLQSPGYLSALRQVGYVTQKEVLEAAVERERMADEKAQREKARLAREMPMLTSRGTKICHIQNSWTYIGYVEDAANQKIKIHISAMQALGGGPPISHEELIWDFPSNWHVCE